MFLSRGGRTASALVAVLMLASMVALAAPAAANHPSSCLDLTPETDSNPAGTNHTITAMLRVITAQCTGSAVTPTSGPVNVDFEIQGPNDVDGANTPETPDLSCNVAVGASTCTVTYSGNATGFDSIRGWIDHDGLTPAQGGVTEADLAEGLNDADSDTTDVVNKTWTGGAASEVDCDDQTGPDTERETNPSLSGNASNEQYSCLVTDAAGNAITNTVVLGEVTAGVNDPDATNGASFDTPDYGCTTGPGGTCSLVVTQVESQTGTATLCFWLGTAAQGQTACGNEAVGEAAAANGSDAPNDSADVTQKTWEARTAATGGVDAEPETDTNNLGEQHTITATVFDQFGAPFQGNTQVRFEFFAGSPSDPANDAGNTTATVDRTCTTNNSATCSITYTQSNTPGTDLICVWTNDAPVMANNNTNGTCAGEALADADDDATQADAPAPAADDVDVVQKTWQNPNAPSRVDCTPETDTNPTGTAHTVTCEARNSFGVVSAGARIDVEATGPSDPDAANTPFTPDFTCTTNAQGSCFFTHGPGGVGTTTTPGTTVYRAWIDADNNNTTNEADATEARDEVATPGATPEPDDTDVVSKTWTGPPATITATPATDTVSVGSCMTVLFTVRDAAGNPVTGATLDVEARHSTATDNVANNEATLSFCGPEMAPVTDPDESRGDLRPPAETPDNVGTIGGEAVTNENGQLLIGVESNPSNGSNGTGSATVVGFFETTDNDDRDATEPQAVSTLNWVAPVGRAIDCGSEPFDPSTGATRTVDCVVTDRFDFQGVAGVSVTFTESGPGELTSATTVVTDDEGRASVTHTSLQPGAQIVTGTITDDLTGNEPGEVDDCDRAANDPAGALPGRCSDSVTVTWRQETPFSVTLSPAEGFAPAGGRETFLVTVRDENGGTIAGVPLDWAAVGGGGFVSADAFTNASGQGEAVVTSDARGNVRIGVSTETCETGGDCDATAVAHFGPDFCDVYGTERADRLVGTAGNDVICAFDGNDEVIGGGGNDLILGHGGNDTLIGGAGRDTIQAGAGRDFVRGGDARDFVRGGRGNDVLLGNSGGDFLSGGSGDDDLIGGGGGDTLIGRGGNDALNGGRGRDGCNGGRGRDSVRKCELRVTVTR